MPASTIDLYRENVLPTYGRFEVVIDRGLGARVWDEAGREYLDFGAGIAVCSLGHAHPAVTAAISAQAAKLVHTSNLYYTRPQGELAAKLNQLIGTPGKIFSCNSGAEANEGLYKLARKFGNPAGKFGVITFTGSFHGRTLGGISATAQEKVKIGFAPLVEGFKHVPFNDLAATEAAIDGTTAAILVEPIQGEGGIHLATPQFLRGLRKLCDDRGLLLLFDEIQCGLGRTGNWCGWKSLVGDSVTPDGISWAKGIANGFPLGAFWVRDRDLGDGRNLSALLGPGTHGTTYGGNPVACAAALVVLNTVEQEGLLSRATAEGEFLREAILAFQSPAISAVRSTGLMIGIELAAENPFAGATPALDWVKKLIQLGLLVIPAGERVIRLLPPLNVTRAEIEEAVEKIRESLK